MTDIFPITSEQALAYQIEGVSTSVFNELRNPKVPQWVEDLTLFNPAMRGHQHLYQLAQGGMQLKEVGSQEGPEIDRNTLEHVLVSNKFYKSGFGISKLDLRLDDVGLLRQSWGPAVETLNAFWIAQVMDVINNGTTVASRDGTTLFADDHVLGKTTGQTNIGSIDISALPAEIHGAAVTAPSPEELAMAVQEAVRIMRRIKGDGIDNYVNANAMHFRCIFPDTFMASARTAFAADGINNSLRLLGKTGVGETFTSSQESYQITYECLPHYTGTDDFVIYVADSFQKPIVRQVEHEEMSVLGPESDHWKLNSEALWVLETHRGIGTLNWEKIGQFTLV
jgi:hypothetical protein